MWLCKWQVENSMRRINNNNDDDHDDDDDADDDELELPFLEACHV